MEGWAADVAYAARGLRRSRGFTAVALLSLALGIGANTALFSLLHGVLLRELPFREPERLFSVWSRHTSTDRYPFQLPEFCDYREQNRTLEALAGVANWNANLTGDGPAERLPGLRVSGYLFELLGVRALLGRTLRAADDTPGQEKVVVLSHGVWRRRFGGDAAIVGRSLTLNGEPFTVVGVLPAGFLYPLPGIELAIPLAPEKDPWRHNRDSTNFLRLVGRARPGASRAQVADDLEAIARRMQQEFPQSYTRKKGVLVVPLKDELTRGFGATLWLLLAAVLLLLLIACANLANLMLVRATQRRREMAIRRALGAGRGRLARQLLTESALLAAFGAALGVLLARWALPALVALSPARMPRAEEVGIDLAVLSFTLGVAALAALGFGLVPALRAARVDPGLELKAEGPRGGSADRARLSGWLVSAQVALMVVLLGGAGLLLASFQQMLRVAPGFEGGALTVRLSLPRRDYASLEPVSAFYRQLEARVRTLPGVAQVSAVNHVPLNGALASADYKVSGGPPVAEDQLPTAQYRMVTPLHFQTMGIPLVAGRAFREDDGPASALVAIVSRRLARQSFGDESPLGRHLLVKDTPGDFRDLEIVGVVGDVRHGGLEAEAEAHLYVPYHQTAPSLLGFLTNNQYLVVRPGGAYHALGLEKAVRRELQAVDPNVAAADVRTTGQLVEAAGAARRFALLLTALFAGLALAMASVGIYGVASYSVSQRVRETGVRLAIGARPRDVVTQVLGEAAQRTAIGAGAGLAAAAVAAGALRGLLFGVHPGEPIVYAAVVLLLFGVTLAACLLPALRAARTDPMRALRCE
jgi:putative ABC transport system permease protein